MLRTHTFPVFGTKTSKVCFVLTFRFLAYESWTHWVGAGCLVGWLPMWRQATFWHYLKVNLELDKMSQWSQVCCKSTWSHGPVLRTFGWNHHGENTKSQVHQWHAISLFELRRRAVGVQRCTFGDNGTGLSVQSSVQLCSTDWELLQFLDSIR